MNRHSPARHGRIDPVAIVMTIIPLIALPVLGWQGWQILKSHQADAQAKAAAQEKERRENEIVYDPNFEIHEFGTGRQPKASMFAQAGRVTATVDGTEMFSLGGGGPVAPVAPHVAEQASKLSRAALASVGQSLQASLDLDRKVLVVWLFDSTRSSDRLRQDVAGQLKEMYQSLKPRAAVAADAPADDAPILSLAAKYAADLTLLTEDPTPDVEQVVTKLAGVRGDDDSQEMTFTSLDKIIDKVIEYRARKGRFVSIVLVTDEVGDDEGRLDDLLPKLKRYLIPVDVIGQAASFGSVEGGGEGSERAASAAIAVRQGPESREVEWIQLDYPGSEPPQFDTRLGPYSLARLCAETGGTYFALPQPPRRRPSTTSLASNSGSDQDDQRASYGYWTVHGAAGSSLDMSVPPIEVMTVAQAPTMSGATARPTLKVYQPAYVSEAQYRADLAANKAKQALITASHLPRTEIMAHPEQTFVVGTEDAALTGALQNAQKPVARLRPNVDRLYDTLRQGEADAAKLTEPRWQAGYYLAMGRAMAAKARSDGYIEMCGKLVNGSKFQNDNSTTWVIHRTDEPTGVSIVDRLASKSRDYLNKVITEHPGTPWALAAQRELEVPIGWKWIEQ